MKKIAVAQLSIFIQALALHEQLTVAIPQPRTVTIHRIGKRLFSGFSEVDNCTSEHAYDLLLPE
jgi:hypothetical protein